MFEEWQCIYESWNPWANKGTQAFRLAQVNQTAVNKAYCHLNSFIHSKLVGSVY